MRWTFKWKSVVSGFVVSCLLAGASVAQTGGGGGGSGGAGGGASGSAGGSVGGSAGGAVGGAVGGGVSGGLNGGVGGAFNGGVGGALNGGAIPPVTGNPVNPAPTRNPGTPSPRMNPMNPGTRTGINPTVPGSRTDALGPTHDLRNLQQRQIERSGVQGSARSGAVRDQVQDRIRAGETNDNDSSSRSSDRGSPLDRTNRSTRSGSTTRSDNDTRFAPDRGIPGLDLDSNETTDATDSIGSDLPRNPGLSDLDRVKDVRDQLNARGDRPTTTTENEQDGQRTGSRSTDSFPSIRDGSELRNRTRRDSASDSERATESRRSEDPFWAGGNQEIDPRVEANLLPRGVGRAGIDDPNGSGRTLKTETGSETGRAANGVDRRSTTDPSRGLDRAADSLDRNAARQEAARGAAAPGLNRAQDRIEANQDRTNPSFRAGSSIDPRVEANVNTVDPRIEANADGTIDARSSFRAPTIRDLGVIFDAETSGSLTIRNLNARSPFARMGLRSGDRIISFNNQPIGSEAAFLRVLRSGDWNRPVPMVVARGGRQATIMVDVSDLTAVIPSTELPRTTEN